MTTIDTEFQKLIPALSADERAALETSLLAEGCRDALVTWHGVLLDGHNRLEICQRHGIAWCEVEAPSTVTTRDEAMLWILANQMARRNLTREQMTLLLGARYNLEKRQGARTDLTFPQSEGKLRTAESLAVEAGVSRATVERAGKLAEAVEGLPEALKESIHRGEKTMAKARREARRALLGSTPPLPDAKYRVIYADPPWRYGNDIAAAMPGTTMPDDHYPTMTIEELCELPVKDLVEDNAVLFLWVTSPLLEECFPVIKAMGFRYKVRYSFTPRRSNAVRCKGVGRVI